MVRRPPISTRPYTRFPYTTLCRCVGVEEGRFAQALVEARPPARRDLEQRADVEQQRPERTVGQRIPAHQSEQLPRSQPAEVERPVVEPAAIQPAGIGQRRQQQRVQPGREAEQQAGLPALRSEEHTSELQTLMRISYAVLCL